MRGMCVWLREISPGEREMATSGGEREERQAWTHDHLVQRFSIPVLAPHRSAHFVCYSYHVQTFVLFERKCPAKWTSHDIPP